MAETARDGLHLLLIGAQLAPLAVEVAGRGARVTLSEPDPYDRQRLIDGLARTGATGCVVVSDPSAVQAVDMVLSGGPMTPAQAPLISLDWQNAGTGPLLHMIPMRGGQLLLEQLGQDTGVVVDRLAAALEARVLRLPKDSVPLSEHLLARLGVTMEWLALAGASPVEIDDALVATGFSMGPFEAQDQMGVDTALANRRIVLERLGTPSELPLFQRAVAEGRLGRKTGVGWYRYPGNGGKVEDPLIEDMASEEARFAGLEQSFPGPEQIVASVMSCLRETAQEIVAKHRISDDDIALLLRGVIGYDGPLAPILDP